MGILSGDVKLIASRVMDDVDEGGGAPTATVIADGISNSIFNDISDMDRAGGRVNLRKAFLSVQTPDADTYLGANVIVAEPPRDANVSVTIFKANSTFDVRTDARDRVEAYLYRASYWDGFLFEDHVAGQRSIQIFHRPGVAAPTPGKTLYLVANEGAANEYGQYVRITAVDTVSRTFTYDASSGVSDYQASVSTCALSDALEYDFHGSAPSRYYRSEGTKSQLRDTLVADAAQYYGAAKLKTAVAIGDYSAKVASIYTKIVPSAQAETALTDRSLAGTQAKLIASGSGATRNLTTATVAPSTTYTLPTAAYPGTLALTVGAYAFSDDGKGNVRCNGATVGTIDYASGVISFGASVPNVTASATERYTVAANKSLQTYTGSRQVTADNRGYVWVFTLTPVPEPGTIAVRYMAQGNWYTLYDDGAGKLAGNDAAYGVGTINYTSGTMTITVGALPDANTEVITAWCSGMDVLQLTAPTLGVQGPKVTFALGHAVYPGDLGVTWTDQTGVARTAADDGKGNLTGDATGKIYYATGDGYLRTLHMPDGDGFSMDYNGSDDYLTHGSTVSNASGSTAHTVTLPGFPIEKGTLRIELNQYQYTSEPYKCYLAETTQIIPGVIHDDGDGNLILEGFTENGGKLAGSNVNYTTGEVTISLNYAVSLPVAQYDNYYGASDYNPVVVSQFKGYLPNTVMRRLADGGVQYKYKAFGAVNAPKTATLSSLQAELDFGGNLVGNIVPGSVRFKFGGYVYVDRTGDIYVNPTTSGGGTKGGTIDYATGKVALTLLPADTSSFTLESGLMSLDTPGVAVVVGTCDSRPLRTQSFTLAAKTLGGTEITVVAAADGTLSGTNVSGTIDVETGIYKIKFGNLVGPDWVPVMVDGATMRYNGVAYSYVPLDASIIGIDPVRLPQDGRVPIFRKGDFCVLGHTAQVGPLTVSNAQVVNCGRVRLSRIRVMGNDGVVINTGYTTDLEAGTVTFTNVAGMSQPVKIEHRIEDMVQISDVQITGALTFTRQLTHAYPVGSVVSSALVAGDMHAHVPVLFDQATWSGAWSDAVIGNAATGTYNDVLAPIEVSNDGATNERWSIVFTNTTSFSVIGEHVGQIATGNTATDLAPINPATSKPYFTLRATGWGSGWSIGNALRFNTEGALFPFWIVRTIQQGQETVTNDSFTLLMRGDVDA